MGSSMGMLKRLMEILSPERPWVCAVHYDAAHKRYEATDGKVGLFLASDEGDQDYYLNLDGKRVEMPDYMSVGKMVPEDSFQIANVSARDLIKLLKSLCVGRNNQKISIYANEKMSAPMIIKQYGHSENFGIVASTGEYLTVMGMLSALAKKYIAYTIDYDDGVFSITILGVGQRSGKSLVAVIKDFYEAYGGGCEERL